MAPSLTEVAGGIVLAGALLAVHFHLQNRRRNPAGLPYPPGPKGYPIIGNLLDIPKIYIYKRFREMSKELGSDIIHLQVFGFHLVVLNTKEVADDLMDKRSSIYSDRPRMPMMCELMGFDWSLGFTPYNEWWKNSRKLFHKHFQPSAVPQFRPKKTKAVHDFLKRLADTPDQFHNHMQLLAGSVILDIAYGLDIRSHDDIYLQRAEECLRIIDKAGNPGSFLVDIIPALKYVPDWFPGADFKRKAKEWKAIADRFGTVPFEFVKSSMADGTAAPSFSSIALRDINEKDNRAYQEELIKGLGATMYTAGADTTVSVILTFFLGMLMNPEAQRLAQEEIDRVIGPDRLPTYEDEAKLPYLGALSKEVFRWQQVAPFAIPHRLMADDVYNGYFIPKDSIVLGNAWAILHDEKLFPDPFKFDPGRFLDPNADPRIVSAVDYAFGFGRRVCPGRWMAHSFTWIIIANTLAAFSIKRVVDANGNEVPPAGTMSGGIMGTPEKFQCVIKPRTKEAELILSTL